MSSIHVEASFLHLFSCLFCVSLLWLWVKPLLLQYLEGLCIYGQGFGFFCVVGVFVLHKTIAQESHFWSEGLLGGTQASFLCTDPKGSLLFVWDRAAFVLAVSCDHTGSIAKVWHLYLETFLDPFFFSLMWWFPYAWSVHKAVIKWCVFKRGKTPCCVSVTVTLVRSMYHIRCMRREVSRIF